jgi:hypothetical protein
VASVAHRPMAPSASKVGAAFLTSSPEGNHAHEQL